MTSSEFKAATTYSVSGGQVFIFCYLFRLLLVFMTQCSGLRLYMSSVNG